VPIEVTVRKARQPTHSDLAIVHTSTTLAADDLTTVRRVPVTGIARTIFGLASLVPEIAEDDVRNVLDVAVRDGRASDGWLCWRLAELRCRGRNGVSVLEAILADREGKGRTESWLERAFLRLVSQAGFPLPKVQRRIAAPGKPTSRVDFLYEPTVVIEVTGHGGHSTQRQRRADAQRRNRLQALGFEVIEFTYEMVRNDPVYVLSTVAEHAGFTVPVLDLAALTAKSF
jgi:very-short-patch-repair endonuclease